MIRRCRKNRTRKHEQPRIAGCGKFIHPSKAVAKAFMKSTVGSRPKADSRGDPGVYFCPGCDGWHFGHSRTARTS